MCPPLEMYQGESELEPTSRRPTGHAGQIGESGMEFSGLESQVVTLQESLDKLQAVLFATMVQDQSFKVAEIASLSARTGGRDAAPESASVSPWPR